VTAPVPHVRFVLERHLGHETYAQSLHSTLDGRADVRISWAAINYAVTTAWWERLPAEGLKGVLRGRREVRAAFQGPPPDVAVFNTQVPAAIAHRPARRPPYVLCTDVTPVQYDAMADGYGHREDRAGPVKWLKHRWNRRVFAGAAAHAPWSSWVRSSLIADYGVDETRIEVIPPGIDVHRFDAPPRPADAPARILFVGGDFERKGGDLLLRAFARLPAGTAELHLVTRSAVDRQPGVTVYPSFSPNEPGLLDLFRRADVFAMPSRAEAFGIAAVEAAAAGLPVIVTTVGGLADLCVDGVTGRCIPPDDVDALTNALALLVDDAEVRRTMGAAARARAVAEFDASVTSERLLALALRSVSR
jgi:glycosyltransferase involved in cell wall biosynthesis